MYLVSCEGDFSSVKLGEGSNEVCSHIHSHDTLLVSILTNDSMTDETLCYGYRSEQ